MSQGDHVWGTDMLEVSSRWVGEVGDGPLVPHTYCDENDIYKKLDLGPNTINVHQALNILARFCGLRWLLSEHRKEADGLPPAEDVERWELHGSDLDDLPVEREKSSTKLPHSSTSKSSVRGSRVASSSAKIKRLVSTNSKKINGMQEVRDILLRYPLELPKTHDLPCDEAVEKQGLSCLCRSWDQTERTVHLSSNHDSSTKPRTVKHGANSMLRVSAKRAKESSARAKTPLVKFDTHVEATEASKHEIVANAYKLGYSDCRNSASPCCPLEHEDGKQLYLDLPPAQSEQSNTVDAEAVEEQIADEAAMEEDNSQGGVADMVRPYAKEQAGEAVK
ncbi:unnamed protein product [Prunus armeniaca]